MTDSERLADKPSSLQTTSTQITRRFPSRASRLGLRAAPTDCYLLDQTTPEADVQTTGAKARANARAKGKGAELLLARPSQSRTRIGVLEDVGQA
jgi:hypothetical protein